MPFRLPNILVEKLRSLEKALRTYVAMDGSITALIGIAILFWLDLGLDRFFEPGVIVRGMLLLAIVGLIGFILWIRLFRRVFFKVRDEQLAMIYERFEPRLGETFITAVQLNNRSEGVHPVLMARTVDQALRIAPSITVRSMFKYGRLWERFLGALAMLAVIVGFCAAFSETAEIWFSRNILLSDREWPRQARLTVEGFDENGIARIARGDSFLLVVKADITARRVPDYVRIRVRSEKGGYRTILIDEFTTEAVEGIEYRVFMDTIPELLETASLNIHGADTRLERTLEVVPPPAVSDLRIVYKYPAYMQREDRIEKPTGRMSVPIGTTVFLEATANKPLSKAALAVNHGAEIELKSSPVGTEGFTEFSHVIPDLREDVFLEFSLTDTDSIKNRQPIRLEMILIPDNAPGVVAQLDGIGSAITNTAVLPVEGKVVDDNGLREIRFAYSDVREKRPNAPENEEGEEPLKDFEGTRPLENLNSRITEFPLKAEFDVGSLNLQPGDRFTLTLEAFDAYDLTGPDASDEEREAAKQGQMGSGDRWQLDVVTPAKLKSILEAKEIMLRQRFEALIEDVRRTQGIIEGIDLKKKMTAEEIEREKKETEELEKSLADESLSEEERKAKIDEAAIIAEKKRLEAREFERLSQEQASDAEYNISRGLRDSQKETFENIGISTGFEGIRKEFVNNRIYTPELQQRIDNLIIAPLLSLINEDFPGLDEKLIVLNNLVENRTETPCYRMETQHGLLKADIERIIEKMTAIRDSMVDMESFNEVIEILKQIINDQKGVREDTIRARQQYLKDLLND